MAEICCATMAWRWEIAPIWPLWLDKWYTQWNGLPYFET
jgi:hypothetical protein